MKSVWLVHNPTAGDEEHSKEKLVAQIEAAGFLCRYSSTKKEGWKNDGEEMEAIAVAGGDGTVRKVVKLVLKNDTANLPIGVLPLGTANNIAKTVNVSLDTNAVIRSWQNAGIKNIDIGRVENVPGVSFFLEGLGFGIFPYLMKEMKKKEGAYDNPEEELKGALKTLNQLLLSYEPRYCHLTIDGTDHSGKFFMVEVMNIRSIGPNMVLAPMADPGDGEFEIVLVPEAQKEKFSQYLQHKISDGIDPYQFHILKGKNISIRWDGTRIHADDEMLKLDKETEVKIQLEKGALRFLVNKE